MMVGGLEESRVELATNTTCISRVQGMSFCIRLAASEFIRNTRMASGFLLIRGLIPEINVFLV